MTVTALIVAAGKANALGGDVLKQYRPIGGKPVLRWAAEALAGHPSIDEVRVVIGEGQQQMARCSGGHRRRRPHPRRRSGRTACSAACRRSTAAVLVHDAARPSGSPAVIDRAPRARWQ